MREVRGAGELTVRVPKGRHHGGRGGGQRRRGRGPRGRGEAALGSARRGGREHVMALASLSLLLSCFCCGRWGGVSVAAPCARWVSELRGGSGWFGVSIRGGGSGDLRDFSGEFWAGGRGLGFRARVGGEGRGSRMVPRRVI